MALDSKMSFMNLAEKRLGMEITAEQLGRILPIIAEILDGFEVKELSAETYEDDDMLEAFINALKVEGRSSKTLDYYEYLIGRMLKEVKIPTRKITVYHLRGYLAKEKERGIADTTLESTRQVFSSFFGWLHREGLISRNPVGNLGTIKCEKKKKKAYTEVDLEKLRQACNNKRDKAIMAFLTSTGCRISEAVGLDRDSVDLEKLECVVHGKGNKERSVYLDPVTGMLLRQYLEERTDDDPALFHGQRGRLTNNGVRRMLHTLSDRAGVQNVHPHRFRRTLATKLTRKGMPIQEVAKILGHEKIDTTLKYVALNDEDIKEAYRRVV